jgi:hypothetical protein
MPEKENVFVQPPGIPDTKEGTFPEVKPSMPHRPVGPADLKPITPIKYPPFLWEKSQTLIREIEQKLQHKVLVYFTHPEARINNEDVDYFYSHLRELQSGSNLSLILVSDGGSITAAWRIANVLRSFCHSLNVIVPSRCASAATLIALSAERVFFGPAGYLTAIDTSLTHPLNPRADERSAPCSISIDQINRVISFIEGDLKSHASSKSLSEILFEKIHPVVLGEIQRCSSLSKMVAINIMKLRVNPPTEEQQAAIANALNDSYPIHGYPIVLKEAQQIGLSAEPLPVELNPLLWELVKVYSLSSKKTITNFTSSYYHLEGLPVIIESTDKRTALSISFDKKFLPQPGLGWVTENDRTRWLSAVLDPQTPGKPKISEVEL